VAGKCRDVNPAGMQTETLPAGATQNGTEKVNAHVHRHTLSQGWSTAAACVSSEKNVQNHAHSTCDTVHATLFPWETNGRCSY